MALVTNPSYSLCRCPSQSSCLQIQDASAAGRCLATFSYPYVRRVIVSRASPDRGTFRSSYSNGDVHLPIIVSLAGRCERPLAARNRMSSSPGVTETLFCITHDPTLRHGWGFVGVISHFGRLGGTSEERRGVQWYCNCGRIRGD